MTSPALISPVLSAPPEGVRVRGTLAVVGGAGESARVYERFARRLAFDGYLVGVFETDAAPGAARWLGEQDSEPRVLVGSDTGAAAVLALAADLDGVIVAGLPVAGVSGDSAAAEERTACPVHLGVLAQAEPAASDPDAIVIPDAAALSAIRVPVLAIHGGADSVAPFPGAEAALSPIPQLELVETVGGLHDALNDITHRSVAARVVLWLERLRAEGVQHPLIRDIATKETS